LERAGKLLKTIGGLHNFCIDQQIYLNGDDNEPGHPHAFIKYDPWNKHGYPMVVTAIAGQSRTQIHLA
jgi:hypothetical protein